MVSRKQERVKRQESKAGIKQVLLKKKKKKKFRRKKTGEQCWDLTSFVAKKSFSEEKKTGEQSWDQKGFVAKKENFQNKKRPESKTGISQDLLQKKSGGKRLESKAGI